MKVLGVDPGLASMGVCVLQTEPLLLLDCFVITTAKSKHKQRRVTDDDLDRMNMLWLALHNAIVDFKPDMIGVESYTVFRPGQGGQGKGAGWKALYAYAMTCALGFQYQLPVHVFRPSDMKRKIASSQSATKVDVEDAVRARVTNLDDFLDLLPPNVHEHAADAVGHALCAWYKSCKD